MAGAYKKLISRVLASAVTMLVLAACGGGAATPAPKAAPTATPLPVATATATPVPAPIKVVPKGRLVVATGGDTGAIDPFLRLGGGDTRFLYQVFDGFVYLSDKGGIEPRLATEWKMAPDGMSWEFTLRKGVKFHNGDPFTAEDAAFTFNRIFDREVMVSYRGPFSALEGGKAEATAPDKVVAYLKKPDPAFDSPLDPFLFVVPKNHITAVGNKKYAESPIGTGPFKFVEWKIKEKWVMTAFEDYWNGPPLVKDLEIRVVPEVATKIAMLKAGEVDIIDAIPPALVSELKAAPGIKVVTVSSGALEQNIDFVTTQPGPLTDRRVRQALRHAVDMKAIVDKLLFGYATIDAASVSEGHLGFDPNLKPYAYDPEKAKGLLAEAGFPNGFETVINVAAAEPGRSIGQAVASYFAKVGVKANVVEKDTLAFVSDIRGAKMTGLFLLGQGEYSFDPGLRLRNHFLARKSGLSLFSYFEDAEIDRILMEDLPKTFERAKRDELYRRIFKKAYDEAYHVAYWHEDAIYAYGARVVDYKPPMGWPWFRAFNKVGVK